MFRILGALLACVMCLVLAAFGWSVRAAAQTSCTQIQTVQNLQNIQNNLSGSYCLANDIDASATATWNGGTGFIPIGNGTQFSGLFDGQNHTIDRLTINRPTNM